MRKNKLYLLLLLLFLCLSQGIYAGGEAPKVWGNDGTGGNKDKAYNDKWYVESASSLTISTDKDMGGLIKALKDGKSFEEKTVVLGKDIDMSAYLWATLETPFKGIFNGNGHTVSGMKNGAESSPCAFLGVVDGGEISQVSVSGSFTGAVKVGGIAGTLSNGGKIINCAYTGVLSSTADTVRLGGIVGANNGGTINNCYFSGSAALTEGTVAGNIAGASTGIISNSYFLPSGQITSGVGEDSGTTTDVSVQSAEAFASGEVSWLLNRSDDDSHSGIWSTNGTLPVYASEENKSVYKIVYTETDKGLVNGVTYVKVGTEVILTSVPASGYICTGFSTTGAEVVIENNTFVMPASDLEVSGNFVEFQGPAMKETTELTSSGFTANWEPVTDATDYLLTVTTATGTVLESYNAIPMGNVTSYVVTNLLSVTEYKYFVQAKMNESTSKMSQEVSVTTLVGSTITYSPQISEFKIGNVPLTSQTIAVSGNYLSSDIIMTLNGSENFSVSSNTLPKEGGELTITYHSAEIGSHESVLTIAAPGAQSVMIGLKGTSELTFPQPVVTSVEKYSFSVKWSAVAFAEKYLLTLLQSGIAVEGYDQVETDENSYDFKNLKVNTTYSLLVSSVLGKDTLSAKVISVATSGDYGKQLNNTGFEFWEGTGDKAEPVDWSSFMSQNDGFGMAGQAKVKHMEQSAIVRPGSAGISSTRIWTKVIVGVKANGTLTCGRINAGSMTATDYANHNYTIVGDPEFSEALGGAKPDSLTVWVKYTPSNIDDQARVSAIIHDIYKYQDPTNDPEILKHKVGEAILDYAATEEKGWQRLSIPFEYSGPSNSADYMLVTFASNKTPGGGSENDEVCIDDMLLIYNPEVAISGVDRTSYKQGGAISVNYVIKGTMSPSNLGVDPNVVTLQLSDAIGSFENPTILTSVTTDYSGTLTAAIPADCPLGTGYRVRVVTTNYPMVSQPNSDDIEIFEPGATNISSSKLNEFAVVVGASSEQTLKIEGVYLNTDIKVSLDKNNQGFSIDKTVLPAEGGDVIVTYSPVAVGVNSAIITLSSEDLDKTVVVSLSGIARPVSPVLTEPTRITPTGFTVNWESVENATGYELTVTPADSEAVIIPLGAVTFYDVINLLPATEYTYSLLAKVGEISSLPSAASAPVTTLKKPVLSVEQTSLNFETVPVGTVSESKSLLIVATDLFGDIKAEITGRDFAVTPAIVSKDEEAKKVEVTYTPSTVSGSHKATLKLSTEYGNELEISLTGSSVPQATKALDAADVTPTSFLAKWEAVEGATYRLTVKKGDDIVSGYDAAPVRKGSSVTVQGLDASTKYAYSVVVVLNSQVSAVSNEVEVTTLPGSSIANISTVSEISVYPNPVSSDLYIKGGNANRIDVYTIDGVYVATYRILENKANVGSLASGTYLFIITDENGNTSRVRVIKE